MNFRSTAIQTLKFHSTSSIFNSFFSPSATVSFSRVVLVAVYFSGALLGSVTLGRPWIRDVWPGRGRGRGTRPAAEVAGESDVPKDHPLRAVRDAAHYLNAHADKVDYPRYRRDGLPCTSSLIESQIKEFHARVKGTEKFWDEGNAEAMLPLIAWTLRDDGPTLRDHLESPSGGEPPTPPCDSAKRVLHPSCHPFEIRFLEEITVRWDAEPHDRTVRSGEIDRAGVIPFAEPPARADEIHEHVAT